MLNMNKVLDEAIEKDASDVHLIFGLKPILRVARELQESEIADVLSEDELYEALEALGYSQKEINSLVSKEEIRGFTSIEEAIKCVLKKVKY